MVGIPFLMNPPDKRRPKAGGRRRRKAKARTKRRKITMARRRSHGRKRRRNSPGRRRRRAVTSHRRRRNSPRRHYRARARGRRRNPPRLLRGFGGGRGIVGQITGGVVDAAWLLGGEAGTNIIAGFIPLDKSGAMGAVVKVAAAVAVAWLAKRVSPNASKMALAGGLASVIRGPIKAANLPLVSANLGDLYDESGYAVGAGAYPQGLLPAGVGAYPDSGYSDVDDAAYVQY